jgi:hypothetical protein
MPIAIPIAIPIATIPTCVELGTLALCADQHAKATHTKYQILARGGYVERQAICTVQLHPDIKQLSYVVSDYAAIKTLRAQGAKVAAIGSGTLLCCPERQQIMLQRRSPTTDTYPNKLAGFGGHFTPDRAGYGFGVLLDTLIDELIEESGINLLQLGMHLPDDLPPSFLILEPDTGAIQYTPLAIALTPAQADEAMGCDEGGIETYHLVDDLAFLLDATNWSQMGFACFQTWREMGFTVQRNWTGVQLLHDNNVVKQIY